MRGRLPKVIEQGASEEELHYPLSRRKFTFFL